MIVFLFFSTSLKTCKNNKDYFDNSQFDMEKIDPILIYYRVLQFREGRKIHLFFMENSPDGLRGKKTPRKGKTTSLFFYIHNKKNIMLTKL